MNRANTPMTDGYLPLAAFQHLEPTAVGLIDLDSPARFERAPGSRVAGMNRDAVALVRLHGEPLGVVHFECAGTSGKEQDLASAIWAQLGPVIVEHVTSHGCACVPDGAAALSARSTNIRL